jgi:hypothetical protein
MTRLLFFLPAFLSLMLLSGVADGQIPEGCNSYTTQTDYCSDNNSAGGSCLGSLSDVIEDLEGDGYYGSEWASADCHLNTSCVPTNNNPCPTCNAFSEPVQAYNSTCVDTGGGSGCKDGDCPCGDGTCDGTCCSDSISGSLNARSKKPCKGSMGAPPVLLSQNFFNPYRPDVQTAQKHLDEVWRKIQEVQKAKEMKKIDRALNGAL